MTNFWNMDWSNIEITWAVAIINIPLWIMVYQYLDAIMPKDYGIKKHPCFCCMKNRVIK